MKLAILVVYFLRDENIPILDLHLKSLNAYTEGDFVIYGVAPRVSDAVRSRLAGVPNLEMVDVEPTGFVGSKEHSYYLNKLCEHAIANGAERLCTMDVDAFPVIEGWNRQLESEIGAGNHLAAVFRQENNDTALPHPSCCYFSSEFYRRYAPTFLPDESVLSGPEFSEFLSTTGQKPDSGIGVGFTVWKHQLPWKRLYRSNKRNDHYLLAGLYGDIVFHLGAMSWTDRDFRKDRSSSVLTAGLDMLAGVLRRVGLFRGPVAGLWRRANFAASRPLVRKTNNVFEDILERLKTDPRGYIRYLRGE
ncbi:hypothetical protein [Denitromonas sp.]|uniref:hypothetical protein n=1 Tax=Denitromonas sp. TaxID=2734609 RepID=UPI002AFDF9A5|nr:hypothetical protein [Denitromonas sp.]